MFAAATAVFLSSWENAGSERAGAGIPAAGSQVLEFARGARQQGSTPEEQNQCTDHHTSPGSALHRADGQLSGHV